MWEHPCDAYYRDLYAQLKSQKQQRAEHGGAAPFGPLGALGLPENRYLDPFRLKAEAEQRKTKKRNARQKLREERLHRNALKRAQREKRAAKKVQRMWRAHRFRRSLGTFMREKNAAVLVQARIRGVLLRRRTRDALISYIENIAITKLQAAVRGTLLRKQLERQRAIKRKREEVAKAKASNEDVHAGAVKLVKAQRLVDSNVVPDLLWRSQRILSLCVCPRVTWHSSNGLDCGQRKVRARMEVWGQTAIRSCTRRTKSRPHGGASKVGGVRRIGLRHCGLSTQR